MGRLHDERLNENRFDDLAEPAHSVELAFKSDLIQLRERQCPCLTRRQDCLRTTSVGCRSSPISQWFAGCVGKKRCEWSEGRICGLLEGPHLIGFTVSKRVSALLNWMPRSCSSLGENLCPVQ